MQEESDRPGAAPRGLPRGGAVIAAMIVAFVLAEPVPEVASSLPPEAAAHNNRGYALILAGQPEAGIAELERAYAVMKDPVRYRDGRGTVLGNLRSALTRQYEATGAPIHLCRIRDALRRHRTELLAALGPAGSPKDVAGTDEVLRETEVKLAGRPCSEPKPDPPVVPTPTRPPGEAAPRSMPPPLHPPGASSSRVRRLRGASGALLAVGGVTALGSVIAAVIYGDRYRRLDALDRLLDTPEEIAERERRYYAAKVARTAVIVTGSVAAVLIAAGVAVLVRSRTPRPVSVAPSLSPGAYGFQIEGRF
jgi:hypothetical protein